jgi:hypothetical protein
MPIRKTETFSKKLIEHSLMEKPQLQLISPAAYVPGSGKTTTPCSQQSVVLTQQDYIALQWEANYGRTQYARLVQRDAALQAPGEALEAQRRDLTQRLSGTNSEQSAAAEALGKVKKVQPRKRGQPPGTPGHGRRDRSTLPVVVAGHDVSEAAKHCPQWGEARAPCPGGAGCESSAGQVQAHMRRLQRPRYHTTCRGAQRPGMVTAPPVPRVIPKSPWGVAVWTMVWLDQ